MGLLSDALEPNNLRLAFELLHKGRDLWEDLREDLSLAGVMARKLSPLARLEASPEPPPAVFGPARPLAVPALQGKRIALLASGGSGATAALCGIKRAFEEANLEVSAISACSGASLWCALWARGWSAQQMADAWLSLRTRDYVDPAWGSLATAPLRSLKHWGGVIRGEAIERTYDQWLGGARLRDTLIPISAVVWNIDRNQTEFFGTRETPDLPIARAVRCAISIPIFVEPVPIGGHYYGDGGIVDILPARPILDRLDSFDIVIGTNSYLPDDFEGQDLTGWYDERGAVLRASAQLRYAIYLELARDHVRELGSKLRLLQPVPHEEVRGAKFYESFLDRSSWPRFIRQGYARARTLLESMAASDVAVRPIRPGS